MVLLHTILTNTDDAVGRTLSLFVGIVIGYAMACIRNTMIYARLMKNEVHQIHIELLRLDAEIRSQNGVEHDDPSHKG